MLVQAAKLAKAAAKKAGLSTKPAKAAVAAAVKAAKKMRSEKAKKLKKKLSKKAASGKGSIGKAKNPLKKVGHRNMQHTTRSVLLASTHRRIRTCTH